MNTHYSIFTYSFIVSHCLFFPLLSYDTALLKAPDAEKHTQNTLLNQYEASGIQVSSFFSRSIEHSRSSIIFFLKNVYNHAQYPQYFALNFSHVCQGVSISKQNKHPRRFAKNVLGLFALRLDGVCVNPYAFEACLKSFITSCAPLTNTQQEKEQFISSCKSLIGACLSEEFDALRNDPDTILNELAIKLYALTQPGLDQDISIRDLHYALHYFLTQAARLLVWSPDDQAETWHSVMSIAEQLRSCADHNLIDEEMLDKLYWVLVYQYVHFLTVAGHLLDATFFDTVSHALGSDTISFWNQEECEIYMTTKLEYLQKALIQAEATAQLCAQGYIVDQQR